MGSNSRSRRASRASWSRSLACEAVKLEVPMRADIKYGRNWGDAKHKWEELTGAASAPKREPKPAPKSEPEPEPRLSEPAGEAPEAPPCR